MQFAAVPRWQWIAVAVIVGAVIGYVTDAADSPLYGINIQGYGMLLPDQQQFEDGLVQDFNGMRLFSNPVVYPHWTTGPKGQRKQVYIVSGQYWDGRQQVKEGKAVAEWLPRCVITQTPYTPRISITGPGAAAAGATVTEFPSVREFLDALHRNYGVSYRYAWWALHPVLMWMAGCTLVIGGAWPTLINLLAYGSLTRPPEVKAVSLWNVRRPKKAATAALSYSPMAPAGGTADDPLSPPAPDEIPMEAGVAATAARPLDAAPLELAPEGPKEHRAYGADRDDFYPTARHAQRPHSPH